VVTTFKQLDSPQPPAWHARFVRRNTTSTQLRAPNRSLLHKRARYYDVVSGEFISRDPLDYVDGMSQYRGYFVPKSVDPEGSITVIPLLKRLGNLSCTTFGAIVWDFRIDKKEHCEGYIIQEVRVNIRCKDCNKCCCKNRYKSAEKFTYWEAWKVDKDKAYHNKWDKFRINGTKYTDQAFFNPFRKSCGSVQQRAEIRFYCKDKTGDLSKDKNWKRGVGYKTRCGGVRNRITTGELLGTEKDARPAFWDVIAMDEGPAFRNFYDSWKCCGAGCKESHRAWGSPTAGAKDF
jgi:hypothetical protein